MSTIRDIAEAVPDRPAAELLTYMPEALVAVDSSPDDSVAGRVMRMKLMARERPVNLSLADERLLLDMAREAPRPFVSELTWRTLADIDDTPPGDLLQGMLEPDGPTLPYGTGGVGKGSTVAYLMRDQVDLGMRPMVYDAENRPREWARRTSGLGVDRSEIVYLQPAELPASLVGRPLWDIVPHLGAVARASGADYLFIDSILAAMNTAEESLKSDAGAPYRVVAALDALGIPCAAIGHTTKGSPEGDPFGSVSWVNAFRLTWLGTRAEGEGHRVRWVPRKRNERGAIPSMLLAFDYDERGRLCGVRQEDDEASTRAWIVNELAQGPRTVEQLAETMVEFDDGPHDAAVAKAKDRLRQILNRMRREKLAHKSANRGGPWALGEQTASRNSERDTPSRSSRERHAS
jgi:hypothetical protein